MNKKCQISIFQDEATDGEQFRNFILKTEIQLPPFPTATKKFTSRLRSAAFGLLDRSSTQFANDEDVGAEDERLLRVVKGIWVLFTYL